MSKESFITRMTDRAKAAESTVCKMPHFYGRKEITKEYARLALAGLSPGESGRDLLWALIRNRVDGGCLDHLINRDNIEYHI